MSEFMQTAEQQQGYERFAGSMATMEARGAHAAVLCGVEGCERERRISFHGKGACSGPCLELLLREAVIEEQALATAAAFRARPRVQLGRILVEQGTITEAQLDKALRSQRATGAGKLGSWLKQQVDLPESDFTAALSIQWRCPVFRAGAFVPGRMAVYLPKLLIEEHGALPLRVTGAPERLALGFEDHVDHELVHAAERMHGMEVDAGLLVATEFWHGTRDVLAVPFPRVYQVQPSSHDAMIAAMGRLLIQTQAIDARMVAVRSCFWLRFWISAPGSGREGQTVVHDLLCTPRNAQQELYEPEPGNDVEMLLREMSRVLC